MHKVMDVGDFALTCLESRIMKNIQNVKTFQDRYNIPEEHRSFSYDFTPWETKHLSKKQMVGLAYLKMGVIETGCILAYVSGSKNEGNGAVSFEEYFGLEEPIKIETDDLDYLPRLIEAEEE